MAKVWWRSHDTPNFFNSPAKLSSLRPMNLWMQPLEVVQFLVLDLQTKPPIEDWKIYQLLQQQGHSIPVINLIYFTTIPFNIYIKNLYLLVLYNLISFLCLQIYKTTSHIHNLIWFGFIFWWYSFFPII